MANTFTNLPAPAANGVGAAVDLSTEGASKTFIVDGTWGLPPTVQVEMNDDPGQAGSWVPVTRSFQGRGEQTVEVVGLWFRVRVSNYRGGGAPAVNCGSNDNGTTLVNLPVPALANGAGAAQASSTAGPFKTFCVQGPFRGVVNIEVSTDGATEWSVAATFTQPGLKNLVLTSSFVRAVRSGVPTAGPGTPIVTMASENAASGGGGSAITISASASSVSSGVIVFSNSHNVSFGLSGSTITASASGGAGGIAASASGSSVSAGTVVFSNSNNVSFGMSGSTITASIQAIETVSAGSTFATGPSVVFANSNGVSFGVSGNTVTGSISQTLQPGVVLSAGTNVATSGTVTFSNSNAISFGLNTAGVMTAAYAAVTGLNMFSAGSQTARIGNGLNATALSGTFHFTNSNGVSFGLQSTAAGPVYALSASHDGVRSVGVNGGSIGGSHVVFSNSNNVSFGLNGSTITASATFAAETPFGISAGTQSGSTGTMVFADSNGLSFGMSGSNQVTGSFAAIKSIVAGTMTATNGGVSFVNGASGISFAAVAAGSVIGIQAARYGVSTFGNTAGSTGTVFAQYILAGVSGVTLSQSTNAGLQGTLSIIAPPMFRASVLNDPAQFQALNGVSDGAVSFYRMNVPMFMSATQVQHICSFAFDTNGVTETVMLSVGVYTMSGSTASLASSASSGITMDMNVGNTRPTMLGYSGFTFNMTPGDYLIAQYARTTGGHISGGMSMYGKSSNGAISYLNDSTMMTNQFIEGYSNASFSTAMPASLNITNANYVRSAASAARQPSFRFLGS